MTDSQPVWPTFWIQSSITPQFSFYLVSLEYSMPDNKFSRRQYIILTSKFTVTCKFENQLSCFSSEVLCFRIQGKMFFMKHLFKNWWGVLFGLKNISYSTLKSFAIAIYVSNGFCLCGYSFDRSYDVDEWLTVMCINSGRYL